MIKIYSKHSNLSISENLRINEIICRCGDKNCYYTMIDMSVIAGFEKLRRLCGNTPLFITSAFRCHDHNFAVGGVFKSRHKLGLALDIACPDNITLKDFAALAWSCFDYIKYYPNQNFCHMHNEPFKEKKHE